MTTSVKDKKRKEEADEVFGVRLQYFGEASKVLNYLLLCCGQETGELCPFQDSKPHR